jgi:5'-nucleotidase
MNLRRTCLPVLALAAVASAPAAAQAKTVKPLRVLVSNDDGVRAPGIDALVKALRKLPKVTVTVVAPADNKSGSGGRTTPGTLKASRTTTRSGYPAVAVDGYPADSVNYAFSKVVKKAQVDLVIAGINAGANLGPFVDLSGTVGAARAGAAHGVAALATSAGTPAITNFADAAKQTTAWVTANRTRLKASTVQNLNIPQCSAGHARGTTPATSTAQTPAGTNVFATVDCTQSTAASRDEITSFLAGFATLTKIPAKPAA